MGSGAYHRSVLFLKWIWLVFNYFCQSALSYLFSINTNDYLWDTGTVSAACPLGQDDIEYLVIREPKTIWLILQIWRYLHFAFELPPVIGPLTKYRQRRKGQKHYSLNFCTEKVFSFLLLYFLLQVDIS